MTRTTFIKNITALFGLSVLPKIMVKQYHRIYLLQSFVRGFRFYEGAALIPKMKNGDMLQLVREPDNQFDNKAIAVYYNDIKIGFLPKEDNDILSKLMDAEVVKLHAEIAQLQEGAKDWEKLFIAVYVLKETDAALPESAKYLTVLDTPGYRTLKLPDNKLAVVSYNNVEEEEQILDADEFYDRMVGNSRDNGIYTILHDDFKSGEGLQNIIDEGRMLINRNRLPNDIRGGRVEKAISEGEILLDGIFSEYGYLVANVNEVAELSSRIEKVVEIMDNSGREFYEVLFR